MILQNSLSGLKENIIPPQQQQGIVTTAMAPSCHGVERKHNRRRAAPLLFALHKIWRAAPRSCSKFQGARHRSPPGGEGYPSLQDTKTFQFSQKMQHFPSDVRTNGRLGSRNYFCKLRGREISRAFKRIGAFRHPGKMGHISHCRSRKKGN